MEQESIMLSEIKERQIPYDFIHVEFKKQNREKDKPRNRLLTIENKLMVVRGEVGGGWLK